LGRNKEGGSLEGVPKTGYAPSENNVEEGTRGIKRKWRSQKRKVGMPASHLTLIGRAFWGTEQRRSEE